MGGGGGGECGGGDGGGDNSDNDGATQRGLTLARSVGSKWPGYVEPHPPAPGWYRSFSYTSMATTDGRIHVTYSCDGAFCAKSKALPSCSGLPKFSMHVSWMAFSSGSLV